jgi:hypothetical protein
MSDPNDAKGKWLVFVDTNIFLDFYRIGGESAERQLAALEKHKELIITCEQVKMEYLKNRQKVIIDNLKQLKEPQRISVPRILTDYQPAKTLAKNIDSAREKYKEVEKKIEKILNYPIHHDPVYQALQRFFDHDWKFNLKRPDPLRFTVRNLARKRFALGYPPKKQGDTSFGDAINWEWIIHCALNVAEPHHVLIVSRDSDYGSHYRDKPALNDWLRREFKDRVSRKRNVSLTNRLTEALKRLDEAVTPEDVQAENEIIAQGPAELDPVSDDVNGSE